ncbi:MAG TPA: hypothetical protein VNT52_11800 [Acidimicrobiales bacterium]|nr:hypothetical protein [Acidimicrobiales bacterium]
MASSSGGPERPPGREARPGAEDLANVARTPIAEGDVAPTLPRIVDLAAETVDGCDDAAIPVIMASTPSESRGSPAPAISGVAVPGPGRAGQGHPHGR